MSTLSAKKQRIKRDELIGFIFSFFSQCYEHLSVASIYALKIPISEIRSKLRELYGTDYNSDSWIMTQLHRYEKERGIRLFDRVDQEETSDEMVLAIHEGINDFHHNQHLYTNQKIRIANGVSDLLKNCPEAFSSQDNLTLYIGSGSIPASCSALLAGQAGQNALRYRVYTHNLAVQEHLLNAKADPDLLQIHTIGGKIDNSRYITLWDTIPQGIDSGIDILIQSTQVISNGTLFVPLKQEANMKDALLHELGGIKVLTIVKDEFNRPSGNLHPYGTLRDYDYIVTVPSKQGKDCPGDRYLRENKEFFEPYVVHWSYEIYRVRKQRKSLTFPNSFLEEPALAMT